MYFVVYFSMLGFTFKQILLYILNINKCMKRVTIQQLLLSKSIQHVLLRAGQFVLMRAGLCIFFGDYENLVSVDCKSFYLPQDQNHAD